MSKYFFIDNEVGELQRKRKLMVTYLESQEFSDNKIALYVEAFNYFIANPKHFNGATVVKDLHHINGLDINAMLHDYHYVYLNVASNLKYKWKSDMIYAKQMEKQGRGIHSWIRFSGVTLSGLYYFPKSILVRGFMTQENKKKVLETYNLLV